MIRILANSATNRCLRQSAKMLHSFYPSKNAMCQLKFTSNLFCLFAVLLLFALVSATGCRSPYHADQGALGGGLLGAATGAVVGDAVGNTAGGAAIGAGLGALTGAAIGQGMDEVEANNRAMIEQQMGRALAAGSVTPQEVIAMSQSGVDNSLIVNHIRANGMIAPPQSGDLIMLKQQGVGAEVIAAMQASPPRPQQVVVQPAVRPVVVEEYHYGPGYYGPPRRYYRHRGPSVHWSYSN